MKQLIISMAIIVALIAFFVYEREGIRNHDRR